MGKDSISDILNQNVLNAKIVEISALIFSILTDFSPASTKGTIFEKRKTDGKQTN